MCKWRRTAGVWVEEREAGGELMPRAVWISHSVKYVRRTQQNPGQWADAGDTSLRTVNSQFQPRVLSSSFLATIRGASQVVIGPYVCGLGKTELSQKGELPTDINLLTNWIRKVKVYLDSITPFFRSSGFIPSLVPLGNIYVIYHMPTLYEILCRKWMWGG